MDLEKSSQRVLSVDPKIYCPHRFERLGYDHSLFFTNRVETALPTEKPVFNKKVLSLSYQARGVCFNPYKARFSLKT